MSRNLPSIVSFLLLALWFPLLGPTFLGGRTSYAIVSGTSMLPTLHDGDLAVVRREDEYAPGDVVAFRVPEGETGEGAIVIHRIVGGSAGEGFVVQGDHKDAPDPWRPTQDEVIGRMWFRVPGAGRVLGTLRAPVPLATLAGGLAFLFVLYRHPNRPAGPRIRSGPVPASDSSCGAGVSDAWAFGPRRKGTLRRSLIGGSLTLAATLATFTALAATLNVAPSILAAFVLPPGTVRMTPIPATVDIKPESLQKRSAGVPVTGFIELPTGSDVFAIDAATVRLCLGTSPCSDGVPAEDPRWDDADHDGVPDLKVRFSRQAVIGLVVDIRSPARVTFTVSGMVGDRRFAGSDTVKIVDPDPSPSPSVEPSPSPSPSVEPSPSPSPSVEPSPSTS